MKKLSRLLMLSVISILLFSSCSKLQNISVSKRHYRSGYFVDLGFSRKVAPLAKSTGRVLPEATSSSITESEPSVNSVPDKSVSTPASISPSAVDIKPSVPFEYKSALKKIPARVYASRQPVIESAEDIKGELVREYIGPLPLEIPATNEQSSGSAPLWVIILFAILIPPLGVFIKFGIGDKFWISLLLTLLFWLPGAIYSVIVVTQ